MGNINKALEAKSEKSLNVQKNYSRYGVLTAREFVTKSLEDGSMPIAVYVSDNSAMNTAKAEYSRLSRTAPIGNECHPETIRLRGLKSKIEAGFTKIEYRMQRTDGVFSVINKTVYEFAISQLNR